MYEIGDKVIYQGADKDAYKRRGTVMSIEEKDGKPQLTVALENGEEFTAPENDIFFEGHSAALECTADTEHKSDLGFWLMANGMIRKLRELGLA